MTTLHWLQKIDIHIRFVGHAMGKTASLMSDAIMFLPWGIQIQGVRFWRNAYRELQDNNS